MEKVLIGAGITLGAVEVANEIVAGVMWAKGKKSDSILNGKYSITSLIRSKVKKDDDQNLNPGDQDVKDLNGKKIIVSEMKNKGSGSGSGLGKGEYYNRNLRNIELAGKNKIAECSLSDSEREQLKGLIESCKRFVELTAKDNSWTNLAVYLFDRESDKQYYKNSYDDVREKLDSTQLEKFKVHVERLISCLRGNNELVATNYNHIHSSVVFKLDNIEYCLGFYNISNMKGLSFYCNDFEINFSIS